MLTHLGNGMPAAVPRHANPLVDGLASDLACSIISDGVHLPLPVLKVQRKQNTNFMHVPNSRSQTQLIFKSRPLQDIVVVSDAAPVAGLPPGAHTCFGKTVHVVQEDVGFAVRDPESGYLAGSAACMQQCAEFLSKSLKLDTRQLQQVCFYNPLRIINLTEKDVKLL
eukprot:m.167701 g.167701  ORF g.167701 m.167701 type:complete len:167 (-) comp21134_c0_seq5:28-528(-)